MTGSEPFDLSKLTAGQDVIHVPGAPLAPLPAPEPRLKLDVDEQVAKIIAEKPNKFTVSGFTDGKGAIAKVTFNRTWKNGWGATAYAKAWWNDASVTPERSSGVAAGAEGSFSFGDK